VPRPDGMFENNFDERMKGLDAGAEMATFDATVHLPYDICISLLSNAESIYILFIVNTMNVVF